MIDYEKEFTCGNTTITRNDYESMPCPMNTSHLTDADMQRLAEAIESEMQNWQNSLKGECIDQERYENVWWAEMEKIGLDFGMTYYEDEE